MLLIIAGILIALWILGLLAHVAGALIHIALVIALVIVIVHFLKIGKSKV